MYHMVLPQQTLFSPLIAQNMMGEGLVSPYNQQPVQFVGLECSGGGGNQRGGGGGMDNRGSHSRGRAGGSYSSGRGMRNMSSSQATPLFTEGFQYEGNGNAWQHGRSFTRHFRNYAADTGSSETLYSSDSGISSRSPTPNELQVDMPGEPQDLTQSYYYDQDNNNNKGFKHYQNHNHRQNHHQQGNQFVGGQRDTRRNNSPASSCSPYSNHGNLQSNHVHHQPKRRYQHYGRHSPPYRSQHQRNGPYRHRMAGGGHLGMMGNMAFGGHMGMGGGFYPPAPPPAFLIPLHPNPDSFIKGGGFHQLARPPQTKDLGEWGQLSDAIWSIFVKHKQTPEVFKKKMRLWKELYIVVKRHNHRYGLYVVGSTMSGFGSNSSDVDMCLLVRRSEVDQRSEAIHHLVELLRQFHKCDYIEKPIIIHAKVPILKFRDSQRELEIDLNCNNAVGIRNTHLLYGYAQMDWKVKPLVLTVKLWAQKNNINDAKRMTISSYSFTLMVIHYLQCGTTPPVLPCLHEMYPEKFNPFSDIMKLDIHEVFPPYVSENTQSLGELMVGFLEYYSNFDFQQYAISVRLATKLLIRDCQLARSLKNDAHQWKYLCIEEPFDLTNTARSVYDCAVFERIKSVFRLSWEMLKTSKNLDDILPPSGPKEPKSKA